MGCAQGPGHICHEITFPAWAGTCVRGRAPPAASLAQVREVQVPRGTMVPRDCALPPSAPGSIPCCRLHPLLLSPSPASVSIPCSWLHPLLPSPSPAPGSIPCSWLHPFAGSRDAGSGVAPLFALTREDRAGNTNTAWQCLSQTHTKSDCIPKTGVRFTACCLTRRRLGWWDTWTQGTAFRKQRSILE